MARTLERGYFRNSKRARQVTVLHVIRETVPRGRGRAIGYRRSAMQPGDLTLCGQAAGRHQNSDPIIRDAPHPLPDGLKWCAQCVGKYSETVGRTREIARILGLEPPPAEGGIVDAAHPGDDTVPAMLTPSHSHPGCEVTVTRRAPVRAFLGEKPCGDPDCECKD